MDQYYYLFPIFLHFRLSSSDADGGLGANLSWLPLFIEVKHNKETMEVEIKNYIHVSIHLMGIMSLYCKNDKRQQGTGQVMDFF